MHVLPTPTGVSIDCPRFEPHYDASETCMLEVEMRSYGNLLGLMATCIMVQTACFEPAPLGPSFVLRVRDLLSTGIEYSFKLSTHPSSKLKKWVRRILFRTLLRRAVRKLIDEDQHLPGHLLAQPPTWTMLQSALSSPSSSKRRDH